MAAKAFLHTDNETRFLNVDVDVWAKANLEPLVAALGNKVLVHYVGAQAAEQSAHFSLASAHGKDPDTIIRRLVALIDKLPPRARLLWNRARARDFNVGVQAGIAPYSHEIVLRETTLDLVARVRGRIVVTTYASEVRSPRPTRRRALRH